MLSRPWRQQLCCSNDFVGRESMAPSTHEFYASAEGQSMTDSPGDMPQPTQTSMPLLERLAQIAVQRDCGRLEWAVLDWNEDAIRFYERHGAKPNAEWTVYRLADESLRALAGK